MARPYLAQDSHLLSQRRLGPQLERVVKSDCKITARSRGSLSINRPAATAPSERPHTAMRSGSTSGRAAIRFYRAMRRLHRLRPDEAAWPRGLAIAGDADAGLHHTHRDQPGALVDTTARVALSGR